MKTRKKKSKTQDGDAPHDRRTKLSLYPLSIEDALRAAAQTGPAPGKPKHAKKKSGR
jgi:hypothetical protein